MPGEVTKDQVIRTLGNAISPFKQALLSSKAIQDFSGLPDAFPVVAGHLQFIYETIKSMRDRLGKNKETQETKEKYAPMNQFAEMCVNQAGYLKNVFEDVKNTDDPALKLERYRETAAKADGLKIESVMQNLLKQAVNAAVEPLVSNERIKQLQEVQKEVAALEPSLKDEPKGTTTLNNHGSGSQFLHHGKGNQNHCTGGYQITGDGATNHFSSDKQRSTG
ncbi:uncharacterized protein F4807DRAFT_88061 [Annulohypoxylon truncatum]|uniref:uncharacterized protein n=1 Tax=Annulohypoxylon truncatum TaxID=327061 RepID=UPI0020080CE0|nr:uncharacterized protein F4807DRAFT_88061 [Annulohypoxylon truncatum]KAI1209726.1 hypothetical protein F4807DRAFT_88061 [Annulohypoxylon truncatum]